MPRPLRYDRETVLEAAFALVRRSGMEALGARAVAHELGCSTQPVFRCFATMEELRQAVAARAFACYSEAIQRSSRLSDKPYKGTGLAYIGFARDEPQLFRLLFMCERSPEMRAAPDADTNMPYVISTIRQATGYSEAQARDFHNVIWIFTHGLAVMVATRFLPLTDEEISKLLTEHYLATKAAFDQLHENAEKASKRSEAGSESGG